MAKQDIPPEIEYPRLRDIWNDAVGKLTDSQFNSIFGKYKAAELPSELDEWAQAFPDTGGKMRQIRGKITKIAKDLDKMIGEAEGLDKKKKNELTQALKDINKELDKRQMIAIPLAARQRALEEARREREKFQQIVFSIPDLLSKSQSASGKKYAELSELNLVSGGEFALTTRLKLPDIPLVESDFKNLQKLGKDRYEAIADQLDKAMAADLESLKRYKANNDYKGARDHLEKINKFADELLKDAPSELRAAVSKYCRANSDSKTSMFKATDFETVNDLTSKDISIPRGTFDSDTSHRAKSVPDYSKLVNELWPNQKDSKQSGDKQGSATVSKLYFLLLADDKKEIVLLDKSKQFKQSEWEEYFSEQPDTVVVGSFEVNSLATKKLTYSTSTRIAPAEKKALANAFKKQGAGDISFI